MGKNKAYNGPAWIITEHMSAMKNKRDFYLNYSEQDEFAFGVLYATEIFIQHLEMLIVNMRHEGDEWESLSEKGDWVTSAVLPRLVGAPNGGPGFLETHMDARERAEHKARIDRAIDELREARQRREADAQPSRATLDSVCTWYTHNFGLLSEPEKEALRSQARLWKHAWDKELASENRN